MKYVRSLTASVIIQSISVTLFVLAFGHRISLNSKWIRLSAKKNWGLGAL